MNKAFYLIVILLNIYFGMNTLPYIYVLSLKNQIEKSRRIYLSHQKREQAIRRYSDNSERCIDQKATSRKVIIRKMLLIKLLIVKASSIQFKVKFKKSSVI